MVVPAYLDAHGAGLHDGGAPAAYLETLAGQAMSYRDFTNHEVFPNLALSDSFFVLPFVACKGVSGLKT